MRSSLRRIGVITFASLSLVAVAALPASAAVKISKPYGAKVMVPKQVCMVGFGTTTATISWKQNVTHPITAATVQVRQGSKSGTVVKGPESLAIGAGNGSQQFALPPMVKSQHYYVVVWLHNGVAADTTTVKTVTGAKC